MSKISYVFPNISGPDTYFSNPIFALRPCVQASGFKYHKPYNRKNFFWAYKGVLEFKKYKKIAVRVVQMKI